MNNNTRRQSRVNNPNNNDDQHRDFMNHVGSHDNNDENEGNCNYQEYEEVENNTLNNDINIPEASESTSEGEYESCTYNSSNDDLDLVDTITRMTQQDDLYNNGPSERECADTKESIQRYLRRIFRQVKFPTDNGKAFKEPNFVGDKDNESQTIQICNWILKHIGKIDMIYFLIPTLFC